MKREQCYELWQKSGKEALEKTVDDFGVSINDLRAIQAEIFAAAIRAATKEEDAKICEMFSIDATSQKRIKFLTDAGKQLYEGMYGGCKQCESAIRASK